MPISNTAYSTACPDGAPRGIKPAQAIGLLDIVAIGYAIVTQNIEVVPQMLDGGGGL